jgi:hypothetical protein
MFNISTCRSKQESDLNFKVAKENRSDMKVKIPSFYPVFSSLSDICRPK